MFGPLVQNAAALARFRSKARLRSTYPLKRLLPLATQVSQGVSENLGAFRKAMADANRCIRYWGAMGCVVLGREAASSRPDLIQRLADTDPLIQIQAARALAGMGATKSALPTVRRLLEHEDPIIQLRAALVVDECNLLSHAPSLTSNLKNVDGAYAKRVTTRILARNQSLSRDGS